MDYNMTHTTDTQKQPPSYNLTNYYTWHALCLAFIAAGIPDNVCHPMSLEPDGNGAERKRSPPVYGRALTE